MKEILADISLQGDEAIEKKLHEFAQEEAKAEAEEKDIDEVIADEMAAHGHQPNLSFLPLPPRLSRRPLKSLGSGRVLASLNPSISTA